MIMTDTQLQAVVDALSAYGIKLQAVPAAAPTPTFQESGDRAQVLLGSPAIIVDAIGNKWTIANDGTVQLNGSHAGNSANAVLIYYFGHKLWHQNKEGNYY